MSFIMVVPALSALFWAPMRFAPGSDLSVVFAQDQSFHTFNELAKQAGFQTVLGSPGPNGRGYTVFAPDDRAFSRVSQKLMERLRSDPKTLKEVIGYMIVPVGSPVVDLNAGALRETEEGENLLLGTLDASTLTVTIPLGQAAPPPPATTARVVRKDIAASNGYIQEVDNVLVPPSAYLRLESEGLLPAPDSMTTGRPLVEIVTETPKPVSVVQSGLAKIYDLFANAQRFNTLASLLKEAGLDTMLEGSENFTVLAPTDAAFDKLPQGAMEKLTKDPALLKKLLQYHILRGRVLAGEFQNGPLRTAEGDPVTVAVSGHTVTFDGKATIRTGGIQAENGMVHEIDSVLIPPDVRKELGK